MIKDIVEYASVKQVFLQPDAYLFLQDKDYKRIIDVTAERGIAFLMLDDVKKIFESLVPEDRINFPEKEQENIAKQLDLVDDKQNRIKRRGVDKLKRFLAGLESPKVTGLEQKLQFVVMLIIITLLTIPFAMLSLDPTAFSVLDAKGFNPFGVFISLVLLVSLFWYFIKE